MDKIKNTITYIIYRVRSDYECFDTFNKLRTFVKDGSNVTISITEDTLTLYDDVNGNILTEDRNPLYIKIMRYYNTKSLMMSL